MTTYASEPGTRLGGRYRLEDRIAAGSGWAAWKAIDETLARAVTVFTFAAGFPRVSDVVTAARAASRLTDPRLAQVFDVDDTWDHAYIVMEWAAGDTLGDLVAEGPIEPFRAARMIAEAAAALSSAHAAGVAHMCLSPGSVRWSQTGEVKVVGLGIDAALAGVSSDEPVLADTMGLGQLLYAALTGHWPGPDYPTLPPAPVTGGQPCSPRQVVAGVPLALSDLTVRALQLRTGQASQPLTTPGELGKALLAAIPAGPPHGSPLANVQSPRRDVPPYRPEAARARHSADSGRAVTGHYGRAGSADVDQTGWPGDQLAGAGTDWRGSEPPGRQAGHRRADGGSLRRRRSPDDSPIAASRGILLAAGGVLALAAIAAFTFWPAGGKSAGTKPTGSPTTPSTAAQVLTPVRATGFDPLTSAHNDPGNEETALAHFAIDGNPHTAWDSQWYGTARFGLLKAGSGLMLNMGKPVRYNSVTVTFDSQPGADVKLLVGNHGTRSKANFDSMTPIASASSPTGVYTFHITSKAAGQFLVIWFTQLPPEPGSKGKFQAEVFNVVVRGSAS
jgi:hypothetical protein